MDKILMEHSLSDMEEFHEYRLLMFEEAEHMLSDKKSYIQDNFLPDQAKILKISDLIDFFILEGEDLIVRDLVHMEDSIRIRIFMKYSSNSGNLYL
jgi:hypothetical protein